MGELIMINKITDWTKKLKGSIYNKRPSNKYLRMAYYSLTGLIYSMLIILLPLMAAAVISLVLGTLFWFIVYLINFEDYAHLALKMLAGFLTLLAVSAIGYLKFGNGSHSK